jgi:toxin ParE1/3/4
MSYRIEVKEQAREDLAKAAVWYEKRSFGLGERFANEYQSTTERIKQNPFGYQIKRKNLRQIQLKKFPYLIIYSIDTHTITIYGIISGRKHPLKKYQLRNRI